jgi:hypothetical protein
LQWAKWTIKRIWKIAWEMWENRNKFEDENDVERTNKTIEERVAEEVELGTQNFIQLWYWFNTNELNKAKKCEICKGLDKESSDDKEKGIQTGRKFRTNPVDA